MPKAKNQKLVARNSERMPHNDTMAIDPNLPDDSAMTEEPALKRAKIEASAIENPKEATEEIDPAAKTKSPAKTKRDSNNDDMSWICGECKEADCMMQPSCSDFLICDGQCERVFHYPCAGLSELPDADDDWVCKDCTRQNHQCAICHDYGKDNEEVFRCKKDQCGLFFHESCLELQDVQVTMVPTQTKVNLAEPENDMHIELSTVPVFTCPAHHCWTCTQDDMIQKEKDLASKQALATNGQKKSKKKRSKKQHTIFKQKTETRLYVSRCMSRY